MQRREAYNNMIDYFLELYIFIRSFSGIQGEMYVHFLDEETKSDHMTCPRRGSDAVKGRAGGTRLVWELADHTPDLSTGEDLGRGNLTLSSATRPGGLYPGGPEFPVSSVPEVVLCFQAKDDMKLPWYDVWTTCSQLPTSHPSAPPSPHLSLDP